MSKIINKILLRIKIFIYLKILLNTPIYFFCYKSYISSKLFNKKNGTKKLNYLSIFPNQGAGIGHQLSNYNSAIWFSKKFSLKHAHIDFPDKKWNNYFKFYKTSDTIKSLLDNGYKKIKLPRFNENDTNQIKLIKKIIRFYDNQKTIFILEYDQNYKKQFETYKQLQYKFFLRSRKKKNLIYKNNNINIAVHIRLGDILLNRNNRQMRLLEINYYKFIIKYLNKIKSKKKKMIYIFSNGSTNYYEELLNNKNVYNVKNLSDINTFNHFVYSDILITSKSSFSYKAGLISKGLKISPRNFWHDYPKNKNWKIINEHNV
jgi:hypothetical protein